MKKKLWLICLIYCTFLPTGYAQVKLKFDDKLSDSLSYRENFDYFISKLEKAKFTTQILYDRVFPLAKLHRFNPQKPVDTSNYYHFIQAYYELQLASFNETSFKYFSDVKKEVKVKNSDGVIPIGVLDFRFNFLDSMAIKNGELGLENKQLTPKKTSTTFIRETEACVISMLAEKLNPGLNNVAFDKSFIFSNTNPQPVSIAFSLGAENEKHTLQLGETKSINFGSSGIKEVKYTLTLANGKKYYGYSQIQVGEPSTLKAAAIPIPTVQYCDSIRIESSAIYRDYSGVSKKGIADMLIYYSGCNDHTIRKPIIISDGFDPGDTRTGTLIYHLMNKDFFLADNLRANGFDIIIVNYPNGADFIVRNAKVMEDVVKWVNQRKVGSRKNIVIGPSMGGLITRYALAELEKDGVDHQTELWISFDAPHQGANIPIGDQHFLDFFGRTVNNAGAKEGLDKINSPAAKQMLIDHHLSCAEIPTPFYYRNYFINELKTNGLANSNGYPQNLRKVALLNGSGVGTKQEGINSVTYLLEMEVWKKVLFWKIRVAQAYLTTSADVYDSRKLTYYSYCADEDNVGYYWERFHYTRPSASNYFTTSYDKAPGGSNPTQKILAEGNSNIVVNYPGHCFIPSVSALDLTEPFLTLNIANANVIGSKKTPFDYYFAPTANQEHITFDAQSISWVNNEIYSAIPCITKSISNTIFSTNSNISECKINLYNVTVNNYANVVFESESETTITGTFEVQTGATLEIK